MWPNGTKRRQILVKYDSTTSSLGTWGDVSDGVSDVFPHTSSPLLIWTIFTPNSRLLLSHLL